MRISKTSQWLSVLVAFLVLIASSAGLFLKSIYARETMSWTVQAYGQDIANIVAAATLFMAVFFVNKESVKAFLVWMGVVIALIYPYIIYAFDIHFNSLFLVYVAIVGLSFYTLLGSMMRINLNSLQPSFAATTKARPVGVFLLLVALLFSLLWLKEDIPALLTGNIPQGVMDSGLLTNPVHVLDLGIYLPAMIITAILLWRRKFLGYLLAIPLLVFNIFTGIGIIAAQFAASSKGLAASLGVELFIAVIVVVSLVLSVLFLREVKEQKED
jgi:hypothetical protein